MQVRPLGVSYCCNTQWFGCSQCDWFAGFCRARLHGHHTGSPTSSRCDPNPTDVRIPTFWILIPQVKCGDPQLPRAIFPIPIRWANVGPWYKINCHWYRFISPVPDPPSLQSLPPSPNRRKQKMVLHHTPYVTPHILHKHYAQAFDSEVIGGRKECPARSRGIYYLIRPCSHWQGPRVLLPGRFRYG